ncbi:hypothetical protein [Nocardioides sp. HB32]
MRARLVTAAAVATATLLPALLVLGAPSANAAGGNKGSLKVSEVGGAADESNDPHVGCTFDLQWYGFQRSSATVTFASQAPTKSAVITKVAGPDAVELGAAASGSTMNTTRTYTLRFTGADPQANQGYHVKVTTRAAGANGAETKYKVFWVSCDRADATDPGTTDPGTTDPGTTDPGTTDPGTGPTEPFTWDWEYQDPTCAGVGVDYPEDIPAGQANDVNIRVETPAGSRTLNFHNNEGTWDGHHVFNLADHPQWDASTASYDITWVQVGGTNYHWQGDVGCVLEDGVLKARTDVDGFRTGTLTVDQGSGIASDSVVVGQPGDEDLELQVWSAGSARGTLARSVGTWTTVKAISVAGNGTARVTFPKLTKKGTYKFRLAVAGSAAATGDTTGTLTVRVR